MDVVNLAKTADKSGDVSLWVTGLAAYHYGNDAELAHLLGRDRTTIENRRHAYDLYNRISTMYGIVRDNSPKKLFGGKLFAGRTSLLLARHLRHELTMSHFSVAWQYYNASRSLSDVVECMLQVVDLKVRGESWSVAALENELNPQRITGGKPVADILTGFRKQYTDLRFTANAQGWGDVVDWLDAAPERVRG